MKTVDEIRDRIRYLLVYELDRRIEEASQRLPHRCKHNRLHHLDARKQVDGEANFRYNLIDAKGPQTMGLCMYGAEDPEQWPGDICEDEIDAKRCGDWFEPIQTKDELLAEFIEQLQEPGWVEDNMMDVAQLLWVLDLEGDTDEQARILVLPWWKRLWYRFLRIRVEPVVNIESPLALLEVAVEDDDDGS